MACFSRARTSPALTTERGQSTQTRPRDLGLPCGSRIIYAARWEWNIPHAVHYFACGHPFVGPENGQKLLVSAWSGAANILDLISMVPVATSSHPSAAIGANTFGSLPGYSMLSVVWLASALPSLRATKGVPLTLKLGKRRVKHLGLLGFQSQPNVSHGRPLSERNVSCQPPTNRWKASSARRGESNLIWLMPHQAAPWIEPVYALFRGSIIKTLPSIGL